MEYVEPGHTMPSRPHITATCCRIYTELKETLVTELHSQNVSFTVDIWSSGATQGYITLIVHWIDGDGSYRTRFCLLLRCLKGIMP